MRINNFLFFFNKYDIIRCQLGGVFVKLVSMDDVECAINNIHNIESISFSDLALVSVGKSKTDTYSRVLEDGNQLFIPLLQLCMMELIFLI